MIRNLQINQRPFLYVVLERTILMSLLPVMITSHCSLQNTLLTWVWQDKSYPPASPPSFYPTTSPPPPFCFQTVRVMDLTECIFFHQSVGPSPWKVCNQRGYPAYLIYILSCYPGVQTLILTGCTDRPDFKYYSQTQTTYHGNNHLQIQWCWQQ